MQIIRDGKSYELTDEELNAAVKEVSERKRKQEEAETEERCRRSREWVDYQNGAAKALDYPQNLLLSALLDWRMGEKFLEGTDEYREDILKGLLWGVGTLPKENRLAIEYWYKDRMKRSEGGALLNCTAARFGQIRDKGIMLLRRSIKTYKAYTYGYKQGVEALKQ